MRPVAELIERDVDVLVVGGGPAGLACGTALKRAGIGRVLLVDREPALGGIPRHCHHTGFGWFDLRRVLSGPGYALKRAALARNAGVETLVETTATGWNGPSSLSLSSPRGILRITARAIVLATGCRERARAARLVPGTRPAGVLTTGSLQQLVHAGVVPGRRAVVIGGEHVSFSAVHTLRGSGVDVTAIVTEHPRHQSYAPFRWLAAARVPLHVDAVVTRVLGRGRVTGVEIRFQATGETRVLECDTIVFTGGWIPDHELARLGGVAIDPGTRGPAIDAAFRTSVRGVFATGNLLHGAEMADVAALEGTRAAAHVARFLSGAAWPAACERVPVETRSPIAWVTPNVATGGDPSEGFILRTQVFVERAKVSAWQDGEKLHEARFRRLVPNRAVSLDGHWTARVRPGAGTVTLRIEESGTQ